MKHIVIRQAQISDAEALADFAQYTYTAAFGASMQASDLAAHLTNHLMAEHFSRDLSDDLILLAEADAEIIGYIQCGDHPDLTKPNAQYLRRVYIDPAWHNLGIGSQLITAALAHPRMQAAEEIYLDVWEKNLAAQRLYQRFGFTVIGAQTFEVASGQPMDADLVMVRSGVGGYPLGAVVGDRFLQAKIDTQFQSWHKSKSVSICINLWLNLYPVLARRN